MKPTLTIQKLQAVMTEYVESTPWAATFGGQIWTSPQIVRPFAAGLADALTDAIYAEVGEPVDVAPVEGIAAVVIATCDPKGKPK